MTLTLLVAALGLVSAARATDPRAPETVCRLVVSSAVRGAAIWIDDVEIGRTWIAATLGCGDHRVEIRGLGTSPVVHLVHLVPGPPLVLDRTERATLVTTPPAVPAHMKQEPPALPSAPTDASATAVQAPAPPRPSAPPCPLTADDSGGPGQADAAPPAESFAGWLARFKDQAIACDIPAPVVDDAFKGVRHDPKVARLDRAQAEYNSTFFGYLNNRVGQGMVSSGRQRLARNRPLMQELAGRYGVPPEVLTALWGLESGFGGNIGNQKVIQSLATLAYDGRRRDFYQRQLLAALRILEAGHIGSDRMIGSWAGAMGQPQFMPTTFLAHATDGDGDERYDIWSSVPDALASAANYLSQIGWHPGEPWGLEVLLPPGFDPYQARLSLELDNTGWAALGVRPAAGGQLPASKVPGSIVLPAGRNGPAFLVYPNFHVIMEWNKSIFYALSVGHLSDRLAGGGPLVGKAPPGDRRLSRAEVLGLQQDLNELGFPCGTPDGMVGMQTRQAIRDYQRSRGLPADAYPTPSLIARMRTEARGGGIVSGDEASRDALDILALQRGLNTLGYSAGSEDGLMGANTRLALADYLRDREMEPVKVPTPALIRQIAKEADGTGGP